MFLQYLLIELMECRLISNKIDKRDSGFYDQSNKDKHFDLGVKKKINYPDHQSMYFLPLSLRAMFPIYSCGQHCCYRILF